MATTILYGQPGAGKSTLATGIALDYLRQGRRVVTNFPIDPAPSCFRPSSKLSDAFVEVLPARPSFRDLQSIGIGWKSVKDIGREDIAGLLLIDEAGPWLDARKWNAPDRPEVIDWMLHSRKRGWDIVLISQSPGMIDKSVREAVVEAYARIKRTDKMKVPVVKIRLPRMHIAVARYGLEPSAPVLERWVYRGTLEHKCFASYALFDTDQETIAGPYCTLPARLTKWVGYVSPFEKMKRSMGLESHPAAIRSPAMGPKTNPLILEVMKLHPDKRIAAYHELQRAGVL